MTGRFCERDATRSAATVPAKRPVGLITVTQS